MIPDVRACSTLSRICHQPDTLTERRSPADSADKDIARLRQIHLDLDEAVMAAYGWSDVPLDHGFHTYRQMTRWTISPYARVEVFDRLLEENHRRAVAPGEAPPPADEDEIGEDE